MIYYYLLLWEWQDGIFKKLRTEWRAKQMKVFAYLFIFNSFKKNPKPEPVGEGDKLPKKLPVNTKIFYKKCHELFKSAFSVRNRPFTYNPDADTKHWFLRTSEMDLHILAAQRTATKKNILKINLIILNLNFRIRGLKNYFFRFVYLNMQKY